MAKSYRVCVSAASMLFIDKEIFCYDQ